jgi:hypothetical protein
VYAMFLDLLELDRARRLRGGVNGERLCEVVSGRRHVEFSRRHSVGSSFMFEWS